MNFAILHSFASVGHKGELHALAAPYSLQLPRVNVSELEAPDGITSYKCVMGDCCKDVRLQAIMHLAPRLPYLPPQVGHGWFV